MKQVLEPAGAAALAAVLHGRVPVRDGERVCVVLSGGNVEISRLGELLGAAGPAAGDLTRRVPTGSVDAELLEAVVVDAEVVGELVDHRDPDLVLEVERVREVLLERQAEDRDRVREAGRRRRPTPCAGVPS